MKELVDIQPHLRSGDVEAVERWLEKGPLALDGPDDWLSPLHVAAEAGHGRVVSLLLEAGATVDIVGVHDKTPLDLAIEHEQLAAARLLVEAGAEPGPYGAMLLGMTARLTQLAAEDPEILTRQFDGTRIQHNRYPLIHAAARRGMLSVTKHLVSLGASVNARDADYGRTPLYWAALENQHEVVAWLLEAGADPVIADRWGWTALRTAAMQGHRDLAQTLIEAGAQPDLHTYAAMGDLAAMKWVLVAAPRAHALGGPGGRSPLMFAAGAGRIDAARLLLDAGADVNEGFDRAVTALDSAVDGQRAEMVAFLLARGAKIPEKHPEGLWLTINRAVFGGDVEVVRLLLDAGANPDRTPHSQATPLQHAVREGQSEIALLLLEAGADPNKAGISKPPFHLAAEAGDLAAIDVLIQEGADPDVNVRMLGTALHRAAAHGQVEAVERLLAHGASLLEHPVSSDTPLHMVVRPEAEYGVSAKQQIAMMRMLLEAGGDWESRGAQNRTPLLTAAANGADVEVLRWMLAHGADATDARPDGLTVLHVECSGRLRADVIQLLIDAGADVNAMTRRGNTPLERASRYESPRTREARAILIAAGARDETDDE